MLCLQMCESRVVSGADYILYLVVCVQSAAIPFSLFWYDANNTVQTTDYSHLLQGYSVGKHDRRYFYDVTVSNSGSKDVDNGENIPKMIILHASELASH